MSDLLLAIEVGKLREDVSVLQHQVAALTRQCADLPQVEDETQVRKDLRNLNDCYGDD